MTSHTERTHEQRQAAKAAKVKYALDYGISGALSDNGDELKALAITVNPGACRLVIKAVINGEHSVGFVYSDTASNCILKASQEVRNMRMTWGVDAYYQT